MDLDGPRISSLEKALTEGNVSNGDVTDVKYIKKTLLHSPIITNIFPRFNVQVNKPFKGLSSQSFNDEEYQVLIPNEEDSQLDAFSEDENDDDLFEDMSDTIRKENTPTEVTTRPVLKTIKVLIKTRSLLINGIDFPTKTEIRASCIVKGISSGDAGNVEEDSLLISLKSGFLLLIRLFYVPRYYKDSDYSLQTVGPVRQDGTSVFKPFIVQWWDTSSNQILPTLDCSGYSLSSNRSGLSVVSASASRSFRIYQTQHTNHGLSFKKHFNVGVDGLILHSCFAEPFDRNKIEHHNIFMTLVFTEFRRLVINLFSWSSTEGIGSSFSKSALPLDNSFPIPVFVVPLGSNASFLFVSADEVIIVTIHEIMSAGYGFKRSQSPWKGSFPTSYYVPSTRISAISNSKEDEILIAADNGLIYSMIITDNEVKLTTPIIKIADTASVFSLESVADGYNLIYASDTGSNKDLLVTHLFDESDVNNASEASDVPYSDAKLVKDFKNWSPLLDISIVDSGKQGSSVYQEQQELWGISGVGKKMKLTHFRYGYAAIRKGNTYDKLRKANVIFPFEANDSQFLLCSFPFESILLEFQVNSAETFAEIENSGIITEEKTLYLTHLETEEGNFVLQVTPSQILVSDLAGNSFQQSTEKTLLFCHSFKQYLVLLADNSSGEVSLELYEINPRIFSQPSEFEGELLESLHTYSIPFQPSLSKIFHAQNELYLLVGSFEGQLFVYKDVLNSYNLEPMAISLSDFNPYKRESRIIDNLLIPEDIIQSKDSIYIGTRDGHYINLSLGDFHNITCHSFLKLSNTAIRFSPVRDDSNFIFIYAKSLWLLNLYDSVYPTKVHFDEKYDRSISAVAQVPLLLPKDDCSKYFAFIRDDGLSVGSISTFGDANVRQIAIPEAAKKIQYLEHLSMFIILFHSSTNKGRLKFFDRKSFRFLKHKEGTIKSKEEESIFADNEFPTSACVWSIKRNDRVFKNVLIGSTIEEEAEDGSQSRPKIIKGSFKVVDVSKTRSSEDQPGYLKVTELTSFEYSGPISNIMQIDSAIIFSSKNTICYTAYDIDKKRLKPVTNLATLPSDITSMVVEEDNQVLVSTRLDSIYQFAYYPDEDGSDTLRCVSSDPLPNNFINQAKLGSKIFAGDKMHSSVSIIDADQNKYSSRVNFRMTSIPRVFSAKFESAWTQDSNTDDRGELQHENKKSLVLCVGVSGEVSCIRAVSGEGDELRLLATKMLKGDQRKISLEDQVRKLDIPFANKVSGTGLLSINKPRFDYKGNRGTLIDYDLDEISAICNINVSI
ncbi:mono-functional DNA-alkylating methyl methanesulfonate N-term-domain-containing protein [Scheffersomyces xylosifermentans]|uniref:mono-functional DNA-alkylating methyl methanesulfonate N-term-domain-containing protein n=1 Tax=Scheffersomyces xylosifermentans TaxID=1304137 RepID=UPI00315DD9E9